MTIPHRIKLKYFVDEPSEIDLPDFVPIFHNWIQEKRTEEFMIDVADYKHVPNGPGIMLVGHEADYAMDMAQGKAGFMYTRKRLGDKRAEQSDESSAEPTLIETLRAIFQRTLAGCQALESESALAGQVRFNLGEAELTLSDRLHAPNQADSYEIVHDEVQTLLTKLYGDAEVEIQPILIDPRRPLTLQIRASDVPSIDTMLSRLSENAIV